MSGWCEFCSYNNWFLEKIDGKNFCKRNHDSEYISCYERSIIHDTAKCAICECFNDHKDNYVFALMNYKKIICQYCYDNVLNLKNNNNITVINDCLFCQSDHGRDGKDSCKFCGSKNHSSKCLLCNNKQITDHNIYICHDCNEIQKYINSKIIPSVEIPNIELTSTI